MARVVSDSMIRAGVLPNMCIRSHQGPSRSSEGYGSKKWIHVIVVLCNLHHRNVRVQDWGVLFFGSSQSSGYLELRSTNTPWHLLPRSR